MKVVVLCAAERGRRCLKKVIENLDANDELTVFTFKETPWEPKFVEEIKLEAATYTSDVYVTSKVHSEECSHVWDSQPDIIIVSGWRYLIPKEVYNTAKVGCFVFHDSLLPKYRGFGPSVWAIRNGEKVTGVTLFKISEGIDEGDILTKKKVTIEDSDYINHIMEKITTACEGIIDDVFPKLKNDSYTLTQQDNSKATYTCKNLPEDFKINWNESAESIRNLIRSYSSPYPGAYSFLEDKKIKILSAVLKNDRKYVGLIPGRVVSIEKNGGVLIGTADYPLLVTKIEMAGEELLPSSVIKKITTTLR